MNALALVCDRLSHLKGEFFSSLRGTPSFSQEIAIIDRSIAVLEAQQDPRSAYLAFVTIGKVLEKSQFLTDHTALYLGILEYRANNDKLDPQSRCAALNTLSKFGRELLDVTLAFVRALESKDSAVCLVALAQLRESPNYSFVRPAVEKLVNHEDRKIKAAAKELLERLYSTDPILLTHELFDNDYYTYYSPRAYNFRPRRQIAS